MPKTIFLFISALVSIGSFSQSTKKKFEYLDVDSILTPNYEIELYEAVSKKPYCKVGMKFLNSSQAFYFVDPQKIYLVVEKDTFLNDNYSYFVYPESGRNRSLTFPAVYDVDFRFEKFDLFINGLYQLDSIGRQPDLINFNVAEFDIPVEGENIKIEHIDHHRDENNFVVKFRLTNTGNNIVLFDHNEVTFHIGERTFKNEERIFIVEAKRKVMILEPGSSKTFKIHVNIPSSYSEDQVNSGVYKWNNAFEIKKLIKSDDYTKTFLKK